ncbi:hypothetical protein [Arthrobacter sp. fls2-241-R2A-200]|uniref:hypothetical protein n=1 Tax=Arthrobacter sp. fls2-241-R2A-200 TaxID=3040281 RepID=UPI00254B8E8A|nr:hypothetical protein [Arthrobacter sp. fls2-241-R2A-200]
MTARASFRMLRTGVIGSVVLGLAAGGHLAGGGVLPEPVILTALCALTMVPVAVLTQFRLSWPALIGLLGAGQLWLHWSFNAFSASLGPADSTTPVLTAHAGHSATSTIAALHTIMPTHSSDDGGLLMVAAHVLATLGTALVLARGEESLWAVAAWLRPLIRLPRPVPLRTPQVAHPFLAPPVPLRSRLGLRLPSRRGPPSVLHAA